MKKIYGVLLTGIIVLNSIFAGNISLAGGKTQQDITKTEYSSNKKNDSANTANEENSGNTGSIAETKNSKPKLIIDNYTVSPNPIKAGEPFELSISFYNTNKKRSIKNIKVVLNSSDGASVSNSSDNENTASGAAPSVSGSAFIPVGSSNTFYIDSISAGKRVNRTVTLTSPYDISPNTYELGVSLEYEDSSNEEYTAQESLGINLYQEAKLQVGTIPPVEAEVGGEYPFSVEIYNTGRSPVYNMMIKMTGEFDVVGDTYYVGTFQPGGTEAFSTSILPVEPGTKTGALIITYDDSTGKSHEVKTDVTANIMDFNPGEFDEDMVDEEKTPFYKNSVFWMIVAMVIIIIIVVTIIIVKKVRKKKEEDELTIEDDIENIEDSEKENNEEENFDFTQRIDVEDIKDNEDSKKDEN